MTVGESRWDNVVFTQHLANRVWTASSVVRRYLHRLATGNEEIDWWTSVAMRHPKDLDPLLVLGCGSGGLEILAAEHGVASQVLACDLAPSTLRSAERKRRSRGVRGVTYFVCDLDRPSFPIGCVRGAIAHDAIHHVRELETLFDSLQEMLKPCGVLAFCEYTGPNRFQYDAHQLDVVNEYLQRIPRHLRIHPDTGLVVERISRVDPETLATEDPSEAVRSADLLAVALERFQASILTPYNGGLLNPLLHDIVMNFHTDEGRDVLTYLCQEERRLTEEGSLKPNFTLFEGRPR